MIHCWPHVDDEVSLFFILCVFVFDVAGRTCLTFCDLTAYETSRWVELNPDRENATRSGTGSISYGTNATPDWVHGNGQNQKRVTQPYISSHGNFCYDCLLRGSVIPVKFLLVSVNTLPAEHETSNAFVVIWSEDGAHRASQNVTVHRLSAYSQNLLFTDHLHDSRLYQAKGAKTCCAHRPCIDRPILCFLLSQYTHNPSWSTLGVHFAQMSLECR